MAPKPSTSHSRSRLDQALVERGLCDSRERAKRAVMAGLVRVNGNAACKPSDSVTPADQVSLEAGEKFVSRGGLKLEHALDTFGLNVGQTVRDRFGSVDRGVYRLLAPARCSPRLRGGCRSRATGLETPEGSAGDCDGEGQRADPQSIGVPSYIRVGGHRR